MGVFISDNGSLRVTGVLGHANNFAPAIDPGQLAQRNLQETAIDLTTCRVHDAFNTNLPGAGATDDLGLVGGTFGTSAPSLQTEDLQDAGATNNYARFLVSLPSNYVAGQTVQLRFPAAMLTNIADTTATLDLSCYQSEEDNTVSADLCATAAQSMNSLSFTDLDFIITPAALSPGDMLDCRIVTAINDAATGAEVIGCVAAIKLLCDTQG